MRNSLTYLSLKIFYRKDKSKQIFALFILAKNGVTQLYSNAAVIRILITLSLKLGEDKPSPLRLIQ